MDAREIIERLSALIGRLRDFTRLVEREGVAELCEAARRLIEKQVCDISILIETNRTLGCDLESAVVDLARWKKQAGDNLEAWRRDRQAWKAECEALQAHNDTLQAELSGATGRAEGLEKKLARLKKPDVVVNRMMIDLTLAGEHIVING